MENRNEGTEVFFSRHSIRTEGNEVSPDGYFGLSPEGVDTAREKGKLLADELLSRDEHSLIALIGISEAPRTASTLKIYSEALAEKTKTDHKENSLFVDIADLEQFESVSEKLGYLSNLAESNPNKKIILHFPLYIKQFRVGEDRWQNDEGEWANEYAQSLFERNDYVSASAAATWIAEDGKYEGKVGPNPTDVAREQMEGIQRIQEFLTKVFGIDRKIIIGCVGHSPNLEALADSLGEKTSFSEADTIIIDMDNDKITEKI